MGTGQALDEGVGLPRDYRRARRLAEQGRFDDARRLYQRFEAETKDPRLKALARNDLGVLAVLAGDPGAARAAMQTALADDRACDVARENLALLGEAAGAEAGGDPGPSASPPAPEAGPVRVAILSFLFNWPSTGGGTVHTFELARFLGAAGYEVKHIYARFEPWGVGGVQGELPYPSEVLEFDEAGWNAAEIGRRFRGALAAFGPDQVIITDSWNSKPMLAEAARGYPYVLRFQAMECLCPLNNVRLLPGDAPGRFRQCPNHQLADPRTCADCLRRFEPYSGGLHRAERALCGVGAPGYQERLVRAFREAEAVLVVNPLMEAMVSPYTPKVRVVTAGMDPDRFPDPGPPAREAGRPLRLLFAGLVDEPMKGFEVLHRACGILRQRRQDFELVATADPPGQADEYTRFVGWQSQADLPERMREADVVVMPTVAQEALGRTAVEAMAAGRPVVASRLGGLPFTVAEGATGLLAEPGDADDLARAIETLLDDPELRERLGRAGRRRFEEHYAWPVIIDRHYRPLLTRRGRAPAPAPVAAAPAPATATATAPRAAYAPAIPERVDHGRLVADVADFFGMSRPDVERMFRSYRSFHESKGYARTLGEVKTLCFEEAFILCVAMSVGRPRAVLAVEAQQGRPTRRILDMKGLLGLDTKFVCFDEPGRLQFYTPDEAELVSGSPLGRVAEVARSCQPGLIFLDRHEHALVEEVVRLALDWPGDLLLAVHDCSTGLCNPGMTLAKGDPNVTSATGVWQRHVLAEAFGVADPLDPRLDDARRGSHRLRIFDTPHGLALVGRPAAAGG